MKIDTTYYERCIGTLEKAYGLLLKAKLLTEAINQQNNDSKE
ncbi:hypothetical protein [Asinibacterium sp. OR53]|nr:hypothetical protein [Asinibacterium sp. OR53]